MQDLKVSDLMNNEPTLVNQDTPLPEVTNIMTSQRVSAVIVVEEQRPCGVVTERDLVRHLNELFNHHADLQQQPTAGDIMSHPPVCIEADAGMFQALVLKQTQKIRHLPVIDNAGNTCGMLTSADLANAHTEITNRHAEVIEATVRAETEELRKVNDHLRALSLEDPMLKIGNRRSMEVDLAYTHSAALRYHRPYSVALFDVDCFKKYNDHYGHQAGDDALRQVAAQLRDMIRSSDRVYRYGGEEILMLLPETAIEGAQLLAQRCVDALADLEIPHEKSDEGVLTMSCGVSTPGGSARHDPKGWELVLKEADDGLYMAKRGGRNQIALAA